jgi:chorismate mutase
MWCRGIRGATIVSANTKEAILAATKELLQKIVAANQVSPEVIGSLFFTTTSDLNAEFPAAAARQLGWDKTPLLCAQEIDVPHNLSKCLRILMLINTEKQADEIVHVYLHGAEVLREEKSNDCSNEKGL